jgi:hypothetical protein
MMNERFIKLGLESGMLNYVDHETPRHYFLCGNADEECLEKFAELIVDECCAKLLDMDSKANGNHNYYKHAALEIKQHLGVEQ